MKYLKVVLTLLAVLSTLAAHAQSLDGAVMVGGVTTSEAVFSLRVTADANVQIEYSTDAGFAGSLLSGMVAANAGSYLFAKVSVSGLSANTLYYYRPVINGNAVMDSVERSFRSFPSANADETFSFYFGSCQEAGDDPQSVQGELFNEMVAAGTPLFFLQQGDWGYPDTTDGEAGQPGNYFSLDYDNVVNSFAARYRTNFPTSELLRRTAVAYVYDDHDFVDNNCDMTYPAPARNNTIAGYQQFFPHYPLGNATYGVWQKFSAGDADFFLLDDRAQRRPNIEPFSYSNVGPLTYWDFNAADDHRILDGDQSVLNDQMEWLCQCLSESDAQWKFISTGVAFNPAIRAAIELALLLQNTSYDPVTIPGPNGPVVYPVFQIAIEFSDQWAGFPASVAKLVKCIRDNNIQNVVMLSGDSHNSAIDNGENSIIPEIMCSGLDRTNSRTVAIQEQFGINIWNRGGHHVLLPNEAFGNSYARVTVFGQDSVLLQIIAEGGAQLGQHMIYPGYLPDAVSSVFAPYALPYGNVELCEQPGAQAFILASTSCDTLRVYNIVSSSSEFIVYHPTSFNVAPGTAATIPVLYAPQNTGLDQAALLIFSNDSDSPDTVYLQGNGVMPAGTCTNPIVVPGVFEYETVSNSCCAQNLVDGFDCEGLYWGIENDVIYQFTILEPAAVTLVAMTPDSNAQILVFTDCSDPLGSCLESDVALFPGAPATINAALAAGTYYVATTAQFNTACGPIALSISSDVRLPVELVSFDATVEASKVVLNWQTGSESDPVTFEIHRDGVLMSRIEGQGSAAAGADYRFEDANVSANETYHYELSALNLDGSREALGTQTVELSGDLSTPTTFELHQNYPNPFNPETSIRFDLAEASDVTLSIFNIAGQEVATLANGAMNAGSHVVNFDGANLTSGVYFYRLTAGEYTAQMKMVLLK